MLFKRITALLTAAALIICSLAFWGCACAKDNVKDTHAGQTADTSAAPDNTPGDPVDPGSTSGPAGDDTPSPAESVSPGDTSDPGPFITDIPVTTPSAEDPTPVPTTPPVDIPVVSSAWFEGPAEFSCDMDMDGVPEKVVVGITGSAHKTVSVKITVGSSGSTFADTVTADSFLSAALGDLDTLDGRLEIAVSALNGTRDLNTRVIRLNASSDGIESCETQGRVVSFGEDGLLMEKLYDVMGTWPVRARFGLSADSFELVRLDPLWTVLRESERWCTASQPLLVGLYTSGPDNETAFIESGYRLYPTSTDLSSIVNVTLDTGAPGYFTVTLAPDGTLLYSGSPFTEWFSDLDFIR